MIFPFCISQINAGAYQEMLKPGNKWNVLFFEIPMCGGGGFVYTTTLELTGDTVIESKSYKKMRGVLLTEDWTKMQYRDTICAASLREDVQEQKVYVRYPGKDEELLYNFNVKVGDTVKVMSDYTYVYGLLDKTIRFVSEIDSFTFAGIKGRKITISDSLFYQRVDPQTKDTTIYKYGYPIDTLYEGMGMLSGPIELSTSNIAYHRVRTKIKQCGQSSIRNIGYGYSLQCFWNGYDRLYHNPNSELTECEYAYTVGIKDQFIEGLSVYPNPTKGVVEIKSESGIEWSELFDSIGNRIMSTTETTLDLSLLPRGIYFIKVSTLSGITKTVKFVKQ